MSPSGTTQDHQALLEAYLRALNLPMFLQLYQSYAQDAARSGLSFERFLLALCEAEMADREAKGTLVCHQAGEAPFPQGDRRLRFYCDGKYPQNHLSGTGPGRLHVPC